jgi:hypothetical protein
VILPRIAYPWHWPNDEAHPGAVTHAYPVPPVFATGPHRHRRPPERPRRTALQPHGIHLHHRVSELRVEFVDRLIGDGNGQTIPLGGLGVLKVTFRQAQAHMDDGSGAILSRPPEHIGYARMVDYAQGGDFEGALSYGIGITWPIPHSSPQIAVRPTRSSR